MNNAEAFEHVELEIKFKRARAELAREYVTERPSLSKDKRDGKLFEASQLDEAADALQRVLDIARWADKNYGSGS
jgi:hypothetical protein